MKRLFFAIFEKCNIEMRRIDARLSHTRQTTDTPGFKQFTKQQSFLRITFTQTITQDRLLVVLASTHLQNKSF